MIYRVTYYLPYPPGTITRHTHHSLSLRRAKTLAVREFNKHRKWGPVKILDDKGEVWATDEKILALTEERNEQTNLNR